MLRGICIIATSLALALPAVAGAVTLRDLAGCKPVPMTRWSPARDCSDPRAAHSLDSALAGVGEQYTASGESLSEYRAVIRTGVADLYKQIDKALATTKDIDTQMHLRLVRAQLANVP